MLRRLPAWSIRSTSNWPASSRRRIIIAAIIDALLAAIIAVPIIMVLLAQPITVVIIAIIGMLTMAVFIIAIIAVLLAVLIAGLIIRTVIIIAVASGITFIATAAGGLDKEAPGRQAWCFFIDDASPNTIPVQQIGELGTPSALPPDSRLSNCRPRRDCSVRGSGLSPYCPTQKTPSHRGPKLGLQTCSVGVDPPKLVLVAVCIERYTSIATLSQQFTHSSRIGQEAEVLGPVHILFRWRWLPPPRGRSGRRLIEKLNPMMRASSVAKPRRPRKLSACGSTTRSGSGTDARC